MTTHSYPPGPTAWPAIRLLWQIRRDPLQFLQEQAARYGDLTHFQIGPRHFYLVNHPQLIGEVLTTQQPNLVKGMALQRLKPLLGNGLLTSEGRYHLQQRRRIQPLFHRRQIAAYADCMVAHAARRAPNASADSWQAGQTLDLHAEMMRLTLAIVGETLLGCDLTGQAPAIAQAMDHLTQQSGRLLLPGAAWLQRLPTPPNRRLQASMAMLDNVVTELLAAADSVDGVGENLIGLLLTALADEALAPDALAARVQDEVLTILLAGHETTANALTFTLALLSEHPAVAERFQAEVATVCQGRLPTLADVQQLVYTRMVLSEALRLYPPAWALGRTTVAPITLGGYPIPANATLLLSQWITHRDPRYYVEPLRFDPERWTPTAVAQRPNYTFFPFGGGSRICIGEQFAWMEALLLLATLGQQWHFHVATPQPWPLQPGVTLRPGQRLSATLTER